MDPVLLAPTFAVLVSHLQQPFSWYNFCNYSRRSHAGSGIRMMRACNPAVFCCTSQLICAGAGAAHRKTNARDPAAPALLRAGAESSSAETEHATRGKAASSAVEECAKVTHHCSRAVKGGKHTFEKWMVGLGKTAHKNRT